MDPPPVMVPTHPRVTCHHPGDAPGSGHTSGITHSSSGRGVMRYESSVTSISWIPSEAIPGVTKMPFEVGLAHYDEPPPDQIDDLEALRVADRFRFANELRAWVEVEDGRIVAHGQAGGCHMFVTKLQVGGLKASFAAVALPDIRREPELRDGTSVRFVQTVGGRTGLPAPRPVPHPPFVQVSSPLVWTTLAITLHADGTSEHEVVGASTFPRHWIYDRSNRLVQKVGLTDFRTWVRDSFGKRTPWGDQDSPALVTEVETALERQLSRSLMTAGAKPKLVRVDKGKALVEQGEPGDDIFLLLDGVLAVEVDGTVVAEVGPGAVLGERAALEGGRRTAALRALTACRVAMAPVSQLERADLAEVARGHRREES
ncbi:MAG: cyclic nucleotide-binding domain-containing protein [Candidatus Dormibacteria bacterium]